MNDKAKKGKKVQKKILEAKNNIFEWLNRNQEDIIKISYKIWEYAELGIQENKSSRILHKWISQEGFSIKTGISSMPTAFYI
jgi:aminobenzoyl-glutamate utilization protein B